MLQSAKKGGDMTPLKELRVNKGYSQAELAKKAGINPWTVKRIETAEDNHPRGSTARKLAKVLGVEPLEISEFYNEVQRLMNTTRRTAEATNL
jgi:DNA-binding XRE family transcriptional regulator